jgi:hypothetical protein
LPSQGFMGKCAFSACHQDLSGRQDEKAAVKLGARQTSKPRSKLDIALVKAVNIKKEYHKTMSSTLELIRQIEDNSGWAWARNDENLGKLRLLHAKASFVSCRYMCASSCGHAQQV